MLLVNPINPVKNQYRGINAHLHSYWQGVGGWDEFHSNHIATLTAALKAKLLPLGYTASNQPSVQIRVSNFPIGRPRSDVTIYDTHPQRRASVVTQASMTGVRIPELLAIEDEPDEYRAIGIYEFVQGQEVLGEPVAWLELVSPSNKSSGGRDYRLKRQHLLKSGIVFVEVDYLHETPATFDGILAYEPRFFPLAHPYRIVVIDPRPDLNEGHGYPSEFDVDQIIPEVKIPLNGDDMLHFDFNAAYQQTFELYFYGQERVDYTQLPLNFDRYSVDDQTRILNRMIAVLEAEQQGVDLNAIAEPLPVGSLPHDEALTRVQALGVVVVS